MNPEKRGKTSVKTKGTCVMSQTRVSCIYTSGLASSAAYHPLRRDPPGAPISPSINAYLTNQVTYSASLTILDLVLLPSSYPSIHVPFPSTPPSLPVGLSSPPNPPACHISTSSNLQKICHPRIAIVMRILSRPQSKWIKHSGLRRRSWWSHRRHCMRKQPISCTHSDSWAWYSWIRYL